MKKGGDNKEDFPAAGFAWSSKLRESDVKSYKFNENGNYYEIRLVKISDIDNVDVTGKDYILNLRLFFQQYQLNIYLIVFQEFFFSAVLFSQLVPLRQKQ